MRKVWIGGIVLAIIGAGIGLKFLFGSAFPWFSLMADEDSPDSEYYYLVEGSVDDGDSLQVRRCGEECEELDIQLCGIDVPEKNLAWGMESRDHLRSLIEQGRGVAVGEYDEVLIVLPIEKTRDGQTVAEVFVPTSSGEIHLNSQMVLDGYAYHDASSSQRCPNYTSLMRAEAIAQTEQIGVWSEQ